MVLPEMFVRLAPRVTKERTAGKGTRKSKASIKAVSPTERGYLSDDDPLAGIRIPPLLICPCFMIGRIEFSSLHSPS